MAPALKTVALDFDGVICLVPGGTPVPGAIEAVQFLMAKYYVYILTARDVNDVIPWLQGYGFKTDRDNGSPTWELQGMLLVTNRKLPAAIYVDDKGLRFYSWQSAVSQIETLA